MSVILSFSSGYIYFFNNNGELKEVKGIYKHFDYIERTSKTTSKLKLYLDSNSYIIPSYLITSFKVDVFNKDVTKGDSISIYIDGSKLVNQIEKNDILYIDVKKSNDLLKDNNTAALIICLIFSIIMIYSLFMLVVG